MAENKAHLQSILQSITHYIATDSLAPDQRYGFGVLNKLLQMWLETYRPPTAPPVANGAPPSPVPGFEQFLYERAVPLCFQLPLKPEFDYSDAQSFQVRRCVPNELRRPLLTPASHRLSARSPTCSRVCCRSAETSSSSS